jgi:starvation-inducible DNA-binding protein
MAKAAAQKAAAPKAKPRLRTRTDLGDAAVRDISAGLAALLADCFALYLKTKNFHWHVSGPNFRDFHLMLDEQAAQIFAMTDPVAERARKLGGATLHSIGDIARHQRIADNDADYVDPQDMLAELADDNRQLIKELRSLHATCGEHDDVGTTSLIEQWIDETERRAWFLFEVTRTSPNTTY